MKRSLGFSADLAKLARLFVAAAFFSLIACATYFGLRPAPTSAETLAASELEEARETAAALYRLKIDKISLDTTAVSVAPDGSTLEAPDYLAGVYRPHDTKTFIIGHSSTIFKDLSKISAGAEIVFEDETYIVSNITIRKKEDISMKNLLKAEDEPLLILMTCYGESLGGQDFSHRLIVTARRSL